MEAKKKKEKPERKTESNHTSVNCEFFLCDEVYSFIRALLYFTSAIGDGKVVWNSTFKYEWKF